VQTEFYSSLVIEFTAPMDPDTLEDRVVIRPRPEGELNWYISERSMRTYSLEPSTSYEVTILSGMADPYGNRINQSMAVNFITGPRSPWAFMRTPGSVSLYRSGGDHQVVVQSVNVNRLDFGLYHLAPDDFIALNSGDLWLYDYRPASSDLVRRWSETLAIEQDELGLHPITLPPEGQAQLEPGLYYLEMDSSQVRHSSRVLAAQMLLVATDNLTVKSTAGETMVWLTDLDSGAPAGQVPISVYDEGGNLLGEGTTDGDGLVQIELPLPEERYFQYFVLAQDGERFAVAYNRWGSDFYPYDYGINTNYNLIPGQTAAYIYTDRPLYRPGQEVNFKGVLRVNDDLEYSIPDQGEVDVTIYSYRDTVYEATLPISPYGSFAGSFTLDNEAALGSYTIRASYPQEEDSLGNRSFDVAEYRKPEFRVQVEAQETDVLDGAEMSFEVEAMYFSGGGLAEAPLNWELNRRPFSFTPPPEFTRYSFVDLERDRDYWYGFQPTFGEFVSEGETLTDADGRATIVIPADLTEIGTSQRFELEATVVDIAGNEVSGRADLVVHLSEFYVGVRTREYVAREGEEQFFDIVVLDRQGAPVPELPVTVELVERRWQSLQEIDAEGRRVWTSTVEELPVGSVEVVTDAAGRASASFIPPNGGVFRVKASTRDARGTEVRASSYVWVSGPDYIPWRLRNDHSFELITDSTTYRPGDNAEIIIASPFQGESYALVTVERGHVLFNDVIKLTTNSEVYNLPISSEMAPNAYISVVVVKGVDASSPMPDYRMALTEIEVDRHERELNVLVVPEETEAGPGDQVTYHVRVTDFRGEPVQAELSLALADLAALTLAEPNAPALMDYYYSSRSLSVLTSVPLTLSIEAYNIELIDQAKGGGGGGGDLGIFEVREDFPDTAYWAAQVVTDQAGEATITVTLPDSLTTWRMDTRAVTLTTLVGQSEVDILSTKPLLVRPQTPRFFVAGDEAWLSVAVHNNTGTDLQATVTLEADGVELLDNPTQQIQVDAGRQALVRWHVEVDAQAERVDLVFRATGGGFTDASRPTLATLDGGGIPVYRYEVPETVGTAGTLTDEGSRTEGVSLPRSFEAEIGEASLTVQLVPSLVAGVTEGLEYLEHFPYECTEQTISRFLPNVMTIRALKTAGLSDPELEANLNAQVSIALQRLYNQQHADGGWGWWPTDSSSALPTAYVTHGLLEAAGSGYTISETVLQDALTYLRQQLQPVWAYDATYLLNRQAYILYVMALAGDPAVSHSVDLYDVRQSLSIYARAYLAQTLHLIDPEDPRLDTLWSDFVNHAKLSATGAHWEEEYLDYWNWNTDTRSTAIVLDTLLRLDPEHALNVDAVRWLMAHRSQGHWRSTQETAWTLMALTRWMTVSGELEADYAFEVALNGASIGGGIANEDTLRQTVELQVEIEDMLREELNRLTIARNSGPGNLYYTTHLTVSLPVEEVEALDHGITISRSYFSLDDQENPITEAEQGEIILGRITILAPDDLHYVLVEDALPAGLEALDTSLKTSRQVEIPVDYDWDSYFLRGWGWWWFDHTELRDEKIVLSADYLPAGVYEYTYLARASTPGIFNVIPPTAMEFYFPEVNGRGAGSLFEVTP
jgi:uncharacterized protein YfaS (alpha-2-macroglobulin family)